jgi:hypothetical protein
LVNEGKKGLQADVADDLSKLKVGDEQKKWRKKKVILQGILWKVVHATKQMLRAEMRPCTLKINLDVEFVWRDIHEPLPQPKATSIQ